MKQRSVYEPGPTAASGEAREVKGRSRAGRRLFVLDTNVLMHDPTAIFRFEEHDVYLPMVVLEELDAHKKGLSEASRNVRQVSRFLDDMMRDATKEQIDSASSCRAATPAITARSPPPGGCSSRRASSRARCPRACPARAATTSILAQTLALQNEHADARVILVSKDINLRIKAAVLGVHAEDYYSDKTLEDADVLYSGMAALPHGLLGAARQGHALLEGSRAHLLRDHRSRGARVAAEPGPVRGHARRASRASCARSLATPRRSS